MRYVETPAPPALAPWVQSLWEMRAVGRLAVPLPARLLPDGCMDIVVHLGDVPCTDAVETTAGVRPRSYLVGTLLRGVMVPLADHVHTVGACLHPGAAAALLGQSAAACVDRIVPLGDVWGRAAEAFEDAVARGAPEHVLARLAQALEARARGRPPVDALAAAAVRRIRRADGRMPVAHLAAHLDLSPRQLERCFAAHVGVGPKLFSRIVRFDGVARRLRAPRPAGASGAWSGVTSPDAFYDQAHFIHEFRAFAGVTPSAFQAELRDVAILQSIAAGTD